jgi:hypothetical protein
MVNLDMRKIQLSQGGLYVSANVALRSASGGIDFFDIRRNYDGVRDARITGQ